ncbi:glycosyltransferase family 2 protein [Nesterenkonia muleiensis]|uniref:glycosyltransferase family 2 protein n=1 Tax=Nesterenkonia muleiensis TaxID=2282648 RepID=UPI000E76D12F|nr:glycosyltransferase family 2 protein [Nesterenkonia muleiensis]
MSRIHKITLALAGPLALFAVAAGLFQLWELALICLTALLVGILCLVIYGNEEARRRLFGNAFDLPAPVLQHSGAADRAAAGHDPTLLQWAKELRRGGRLQWFANTARETRLTGARDVLALSATSGTYDYRALAREIESLRFRSTDLQRRSQFKELLWLPAYLSLARVLYSQRLDNRDLFTCLSLYALAEELYGLRVFTDGVDRSHYSDLLTWNGEFSKADEVLDYQDPDAERDYSQRYLRLNTVNPNVTGDRHQAGQWGSLLAEEFGRYHLAQPTFEDPAAPSFYQIRCEAPPAQGKNLPLVTVIMPIYEPNAATDVAIRSLLNQSWSNLEIIIIDDASPQHDEQGSPTAYRAQLEGWAAQDSRIRLILCEQNRGAYSVRNEAFELATGEFVTIADKDDWHHPQRIERQVRDLIRHPEKHANIVQWVRVDEHLKFQVRWGPDRVIHPSFASIMFRRETVKEKLGYWDAVRKSADNEYKKRFELVFNTKLVADDPIPLAFSLLGEDNLTSADFGLGYRHPDREIYQRAYGAWHQDIRAGASAYMPMNPDKRLFVAPPSFLPERDKTHIPHYDVIYLSEFGALGGNTLGLVQEIEAALEAGLTVGFIALQNGLVPSAAKRRLVPEVERLFLQGRIDWLSLDRAAITPLMVIHWPTVLQLDPGLVSKVDAAQIVVVANQLPAALSSDDRYYSIDQVSRNCLAALGQQPLWAPQSALARSYLTGQLPPQELLDYNWISVISYVPQLRHDEHDVARVPVIGRPVYETESHWPSRTLRSQIYPSGGDIRVELRAQPEALRQRGVIGPDGVPPTWTVEPPGEESFLDYLQALDFLVCFDERPWHESVEPSVLAALKTGVVVVLSPEYREVYGEAAVYAEPKDVRRTLKKLWEDPESYARQQQSGIAFLQQNRSASDYLARIKYASADQILEGQLVS